MAENPQIDIEAVKANAQAGLATVAANSGAIGAMRQTELGMGAPEQQAARNQNTPSMDAAKSAIDPSILQGLAGSRHAGSADKPVVGTQTANLAAQRANGGERSR